MQLYSIRFYNQLYLINFFLSIVVQCCTVCISMKAAFGELIPCNYGKKCAFGRLKCRSVNENRANKRKTQQIEEKKLTNTNIRYCFLC